MAHTAAAPAPLPLTTRLRLFAQSTPGRLIGLGLLLTCLCAAAGSITAGTVQDRQTGLDVLLQATEPDAQAAYRLYTALSVADAAASTAFISGGLEPPAVRMRYRQALNESATELINLAATDTPDQNLRTRIATGLTVYAGLVETARANNRSGYPVGAAYLSEASHQMQTSLLPMASQLRTHRTEAVIHAQDQHVRPPWPAIGLLILAGGGLIAAQIYLVRRWHRMWNPGFLLASIAIGVLGVWTVLAGTISATTMTHGRSNASAATDRLTDATILVQQSRSAETLKLVRRDVTGDYDQTYDHNRSRLRSLLSGDDPGAAAARTALDNWHAAHLRMNEALDRGDFAAAAQVATGASDTDSAAAVTAAEQALRTGITETRSNLRDTISRSARILDFLAPAALILGGVAVLGVVLGIRPRLREYR